MRYEKGHNSPWAAPGSTRPTPSARPPTADASGAPSTSGATPTSGPGRRTSSTSCTGSSASRPTCARGRRTRSARGTTPSGRTGWSKPGRGSAGATLPTDGALAIGSRRPSGAPSKARPRWYAWSRRGPQRTAPVRRPRERRLLPFGGGRLRSPRKGRRRMRNPFTPLSERSSSRTVVDRSAGQPVG